MSKSNETKTQTHTNTRRISIKDSVEGASQMKPVVSGQKKPKQTKEEK